jgi:Mg2+ and Co2+ transporter CorA
MLDGIVRRKRPMLKRIARVSGLIGVGVVFLANFLNDHAVAQLQEDAANVDAVQSDSAQAKDASASGLDQLKAAERIYRLEVNVATVTSRSRAEEVQSILDSALLYFTTLDSSVGALGDSLTEAKEIPDRGVALRDGTMGAVQQVSEQVTAIRATVEEKRQELQKLKSDHEAAESEAEADRITESINQTFDEFDELEAQYKAIASSIAALFADIEGQVDAERDASENAANTMNGLVYVLSALGASIAAFGNWLGGRLSVTGESRMPDDTAAAI